MDLAIWFRVTDVRLLLTTVQLVWMVWGCRSQRIVYETEDSFGNDQRSGDSLTMDGIPEKILIRMKDVYNATDFMQNFVVTSSSDNRRMMDAANINARRAFAAAAANGVEIAQFADCRPEEQVIKVEKPSTSGVMIWPPCVRVKRCGGCCTSKLLMCRPTAVSTVNITVLQVRISPQHVDRFESDGQKTISLEQHDKCRCSCKQLPEECVPGVQEYRPSECRCACIDQELALMCQGPERLWDDADCACKCRYPSECSTGFFYSFRTCRCEVFRASLFSAYRPPITTRDYGRVRYESVLSNQTSTSRA